MSDLYGYRFINRHTGEVLETTADEMRVARMRKRVSAWSRSAQFRADYILVTLTYRERDAWSARHVSQFMRHVRRHLGDALFAYVWVAELQRRGAVHYHVVLVVASGSRIPKPDAAGWWQHGMTKVQLVRQRRGALAYVRKYVTKATDTARFPRGLRLFAVAIRRAFVDQNFSLRWWSTPAWLRAEVAERGMVIAGVVVLKRLAGGWLVGDEVFKSPWAIERFIVVLSQRC